MKIRYVQPADDRLAVSRVYEESWKAAYKGIIPQAYLDSIPVGRWAGTPDTSGLNSLVMLDGDTIIGTTCFCPSRFEDMAGWGEVVSLYLLPGYMGRGLGKSLLRAAVDELKSMGFRDIFLWVLENNHRARRFYERFGFKQSDAFLNDRIGGRALREIQYCMHID